MLAELGLRATGLGASTGASAFRTGGALRDHVLAVPDPDLLYRLNARGWRGPEVSDEKAPGALRIACLGDSCTFGLGVREEHAWPFRLQRLLAGLYGDQVEVEVIDAGVSGYSTWQDRVQLERDVLPLRPDVVVLLPTGANDAAATNSFTDAEATARNRSLLGLIERTRLARLGGLFQREPVAEWDLAELVPGSRRRVSEREFADNLDAMATACREAGAAFVLVVPAFPPTARARSAVYERTAAAVVERAHELEVPLADPRPLFLGTEPTPAFLDLVHPDLLGHTFLAQAVLAVLAQDVPCLADLPRASFVVPWLRARREGLAAIDVDTCLDHAPGTLRALLPIYADPCRIEQALASGRPETVARYDPLSGTEARRWPEQALRLQARQAETAGDHEEAAELRERADRIRDEVWPADPFARLMAGLPDEPGAAPVRLARALATFGRELGMAGQPRDVQLGQVLALRGDGQLESALDLVDTILDLAPVAPGPLQQRIAVLRALGKSDEARATEDHLLATSPRSAAACLLRGRRACTAGLTEEAERELRTAVQQEPALVGARYLLGRLLLEQGRLDEAEVQLGTAQAFDPELTEVQGLLARVAEERAARGTASGPVP